MEAMAAASQREGEKDRNTPPPDDCEALRH